jgi:hypothetical protein
LAAVLLRSHTFSIPPLTPVPPVTCDTRADGDKDLPSLSLSGLSSSLSVKRSGDNGADPRSLLYLCPRARLECFLEDDEFIRFKRADGDKDLLSLLPLSKLMLPSLFERSGDKDAVRPPLVSPSLILDLCLWFRSRCMLAFLNKRPGDEDEARGPLLSLSLRQPFLERSLVDEEWVLEELVECLYLSDEEESEAVLICRLVLLDEVECLGGAEDSDAVLDCRFM